MSDGCKHGVIGFCDACFGERQWNAKIQRIATLEAELAASREKLEGREVVLRHAEQRIAQLEQALSEMTARLAQADTILSDHEHEDARIDEYFSEGKDQKGQQ